MAAQQHTKEIVLSAYVIVSFNPINDEKLKEYGASVPPTLAKYSGEILAKGSSTTLHGTSQYKTQVIVQFPSREMADKWYHSEEYQNLIPVRNEGMDAEFKLLG